MTGRRLWMLALMSGLAGCTGTNNRMANSYTPGPPCSRCGQPDLPPGARLAPQPGEPAGAPPVLSPFTPSSPSQLPPYTPPPTAGDSSGPVGKLEPPQKYTPEPAYAQVRLDLPVPVQTDAKPTPPMPPASDLAARVEPRDAAEPALVDLPGFAVVRAKVANGQEPFPDGIAWLQTKGYRTVLHLRAPGEDTTAARRQFEKRGLQYISLEVAPGALTKELAEQFNHIVADETNLPLFVCDKDGALTGTLWYLSFRMNGVADDKALADTTRFGFRPEQDNDHKALLNAARTLLAAQQP